MPEIASKEVKKRIEIIAGRMERCDLCPRECGVNRFKGEKGVCLTGTDAVVSSFGPHFGEESVLVGAGGSGTIFFTHCNLGCIFCQNWDISHLGIGEVAGQEELASFMLSLQNAGCENINLVSPTHVLYPVLKALEIAWAKGLRLPIVYNTGGYDKPDVIRLLDGIIDIYMPDMKFASSSKAKTYCSAEDYPYWNRLSVRQMHSQVGDLETDNKGITKKGLLIRHLVMPGCLEDTTEILKFIKDNLPDNTYINIMAQYRPLGGAKGYPEINRRPTQEEIYKAHEIALSMGLRRLDH
ncbi:MAG: radical SAM protein [Deltaproteobacteria bacterium]|nr:radical SAM protein [Deltaproteobacteria bacterium]